MSASFASFAFRPPVQAAIDDLQYKVPTPIQHQSIPVVLSGRDLIGLAQTGTGKTAAFALPIAERIHGQPRGPVRALVIAPTRELADQINEVFVLVGKKTKIRSTTVYGGVSFNRQLEALRTRVEVVVGCPGRLLDHLEQGTLDLSQLEILVLDEADQMFDMGFLPTIRKILRRVNPRRQTLLYSATMPDDIKRLAHEVLNNPETISVSNTNPAETVAHALYPVRQEHKQSLLLRLLEVTESRGVLIFTRTKHGAKRLSQQLTKRGYSTAALQGNLSQNRRQEAIAGFRSGQYDILVATDIAARGIDIASVTHVINYDVPSTVEAYTHRIGRTGRAARTGDAFTLYTSEDASMIRSIERTLGRRIERRSIEGFEPVEIERESTVEPVHNRRQNSGGQPRRHSGGANRGGRSNHGERRSDDSSADRRFAARPSNGDGNSNGTSRGAAAQGSRGATAPSSRGATAPSSRGATAPSSRGATAPSSRGATAPSYQGATAPSSQGATAPSSRGATAPRSRGATAPNSRGATAPRSRGTTPPSANGSRHHFGSGERQRQAGSRNGNARS